LALLAQLALLVLLIGGVLPLLAEFPAFILIFGFASRVVGVVSHLTVPPSRNSPLDRSRQEQGGRAGRSAGVTEECDEPLGQRAICDEAK
jgi:hypothetical protein